MVPPSPVTSTVDHSSIVMSVPITSPQESDGELPGQWDAGAACLAGAKACWVSLFFEKATYTVLRPEDMGI